MSAAVLVCGVYEGWVHGWRIGCAQLAPNLQRRRAGAALHSVVLTAPAAPQTQARLMGVSWERGDGTRNGHGPREVGARLSSGLPFRVPVS